MKKLIGNMLFGKGTEGKRGVSLQYWEEREEYVVSKTNREGNHTDGDYYTTKYLREESSFKNAIVRYVYLIFREYKLGGNYVARLMEQVYMNSIYGTRIVTIDRKNPWTDHKNDHVESFAVEMIKEEYVTSHSDREYNGKIWVDVVKRIQETIRENDSLDGIDLDYLNGDREDGSIYNDLMGDGSASINMMGGYIVTVRELDEFLIRGDQ